MNRIAVCFCVLLFSNVAFAQISTPPQQEITSTAPTEVANFQKIEDAWSNAVNMRDQYALELVLSPLFVNVSATGEITTRNQQVAEMISSDDKTPHLDQRVVTVRMMGDIAVVNGTYTYHHKVGSAQVDEKGVFTHVFERVRGNWLCVNSQRTMLPEEAKAKTKKQSGSDLPFHLPLFSKGDKKDQQ